MSYLYHQCNCNNLNVFLIIYNLVLLVEQKKHCEGDVISHIIQNSHQPNNK